VEKEREGVLGWKVVLGGGGEKERRKMK